MGPKERKASVVKKTSVRMKTHIVRHYADIREPPREGSRSFQTDITGIKTIRAARCPL